MTSSAEHTQEGASRFALLKPSSIFNVPLSHEDLVTISQVSTKHRDFVRDLIRDTKTLDLSQFWSRFGSNEFRDRVKSLEDRISHVDELENISFSWCNKVNDETFLHVLSCIAKPEKVKRLELYYCHRLTDKGLKEMASILPNLEFLNLGRCMKITDKCIANLRVLKKLRYLSLKRCPNISEDALMTIEEQYLSIVELDVTKCMKVDQEREPGSMVNANTGENIRIILHGPRQTPSPAAQVREVEQNEPVV